MLNIKNNSNQNNYNNIFKVIKHAYKYLRQWFVLLVISFAFVALNAGLCNYFNDPELNGQYSLIMKIVIVVFSIYAALVIYRYVRLIIVLISLQKNALQIKAMFDIDILKLIYACYIFPLVFAFILLSKIRLVYKASLTEFNNGQLINDDNKNVSDHFSPNNSTIKKINELDQKINNMI